ncbi:MAG: hypothetical protein PUF97_01410 [Bifidobacteriaceae bacterium]|nr:hypothetical protein [Bifidobacteriaceae bacterium]
MRFYHSAVEKLVSKHEKPGKRHFSGNAGRQYRQWHRSVEPFQNVRRNEVCLTLLAQHGDQLATKFDSTLLHAMVAHITIHDRDHIVFTMKDGSQIEAGWGLRRNPWRLLSSS